MCSLEQASGSFPIWKLREERNENTSSNEEKYFLLYWGECEYEDIRNEMK